MNIKDTLSKYIWCNSYFNTGLNIVLSSILMQVVQLKLLNSQVLLWGVIITMVASSFISANKAHYLASVVPQPYGTLILTFSSLVVEVGILIALLNFGKHGLDTVLYTSFSLVMLSLNFFSSLSLVVGGWRYNRQRYNLRGASSYLALLISITSNCFIIPKYFHNEYLTTLQALGLSTIFIFLYIVFLITQTITHRDFFIYVSEDASPPGYYDNIPTNIKLALSKKIIFNTLALLINLIISVRFSKILSMLLPSLLPEKLKGLLVSFLILLPEGISAIKAAYNNDLQRSINVCLGSVAASLSTTIPIIIIYSLMQGNQIRWHGLADFEVVILTITYLLQIVTYNSIRTSFLYGFCSLGLFMIYLTFLI